VPEDDAHAEALSEEVRDAEAAISVAEKIVADPAAAFEERRHRKFD
jgi:hypothetical protein